MEEKYYHLRVYAELKDKADFTNEFHNIACPDTHQNL